MGKLEVLKLVAKVFKGITVESFNERFVGLTDSEIYEYTAQQQGLIKRYKVTSDGVSVCN